MFNARNTGVANSLFSASALRLMLVKVTFCPTLKRSPACCSELTRNVVRSKRPLSPPMMPSWEKWLAPMAMLDVSVPLVYNTLWLAIGARWNIASCQLVPSPKLAGSDNPGRADRPAAARLSFISVAYSSAFNSAMYFQGSWVPT